MEEFRQRWALPIRPAEKRNKDSYIELMNSDLACGHIQVEEESPLVEEWKLLQWDEDRRKEDPRFENHLSDACLYAWRESKHYTYVEELAPPKLGTPEYYKSLESRIWQSQEDALAIQDTQSWWDDGWNLN